jgi:transcriptional regulator with XRE-family HTH domain
MQRFGEKLRSLRRRQGLSQIQLGDKLDVQQSYVGKMERGERTPNVAMLLKIAELFNVSFDQLMNDDLEID